MIFHNPGVIFINKSHNDKLITEFAACRINVIVLTSTIFNLQYKFR